MNPDKYFASGLTGDMVKKHIPALPPAHWERRETQDKGFAEDIDVLVEDSTSRVIAKLIPALGYSDYFNANTEDAPHGPRGIFLGSFADREKAKEYVNQYIQDKHDRQFTQQAIEIAAAEARRKNG